MYGPGLRQPLTCDQFVAALDGWTGRPLRIRLVTDSDDLITVVRVTLGERTEEKHPALFWPILLDGCPAGAETSGLYLHPERFESAAVHVGETVLELRQSGVRLNIRRP